MHFSAGKLRGLLWYGRLLFLACAIGAAPSPAGAFGIDWDTIGWVGGAASPQFFANVDGSGVDLTVSYTSNMWNGTPNVHAPIPVTLPANQIGLLRFTNDRDPLIERTTVSLIFSQPVLIDSTGLRSLSIVNALWQEHGIVAAFDAAGAPVFASSYGTSDGTLVMLDVDGDASYETIGTGSQEAGEYGDAMLSYLRTPVSRIDFSLEVTSPGQPALITGFASILIKDTIFLVPEPAALALGASGLLGIAVLGRKRGARPARV